MAKWQELCELLMDKELTPQEIVEKLRVKPCRLKQMLESKRLAERLELVEKIAAVRADHAILVAMEAAADKLAALATKDTETGRKACLDVLAQGQALRTQRESARPNRLVAGLTNWHKGVRKWQREEERRAERQAAEAKESPPDEWQEAARPAEAAAPTDQPAPAGSADAAVSPRRQRREAPPRRMSKSKRRELAGLPPEKKRPIPVVAPPPGYRVDGGFVPRPGGRVVQHLVCGKVFLGST